MTFRRKLYDRLLHWKHSRGGKTALLIEGARRVGKSYVVSEFARREYKSAVVIDFSSPPPLTLSAILENPHDLDGLFNRISLECHTRLYRRESLIVFDEVQLCPKARQLIKHLVADGRYDYIETGSLITLKTSMEGILIPSEEERVTMNPMDFDEFCWAMGESVTPEFVRECFEKRKPLGALLKPVMARYCEYLCVGGMPQAVAEYAQTRDIASADIVKRDILKLYRDDISKFAGSHAAKVRSLFDQIPGQLTKKEKRYSLASLGKSSRMREYEDAFAWLADARVVNPCYNATDPSVGMALSSDFATLKLYMGDTGLLMTLALGDESATAGDLYRAVFTGDVAFNRGMVAENAVAQSLVQAGRSLFFYSRRNPESHRSDMEVDFLIRREGKICPLEVKSGKYQHHASLDKFCKKFRGRLGQPCILYTKDIMEKDGILHLPLFMASLL